MDNDLLLSVSLMCLVILLLIFILKKIKQPYLVAYILAGIMMGPDLGGFFKNTSDVAALGEIGILLLMFFLGIEMKIPDHRSLLLKPVVAQVIRMILSFMLVFVLGMSRGWTVSEIVVLTVLLIFNSTAVVSEVLSRNGELRSDLGKTILNILLLQDVLLAPVLTVFQFLGNGYVSLSRLFSSLLGSVIIVLLLKAVRDRNFFDSAIFNEIKKDHELQVFAGGFICLGFGLLAELAGLSGAIGSFMAGMFIGRTSALHWLEHTLRPFRVFFVSLFFVSVGLSLDISYVSHHYQLMMSATLLVLIVNSLLSAVVFRLLKYDWKNSFYAGALLSQTGEFGILACSLAFEMKIIDLGFYKVGIAVTAISLLLSTIWIAVLRKLVN